MRSHRVRRAIWSISGAFGLTLSLALPATGFAFGPQPPDQVDVFFSSPLKPNVELLWDSSNSMKDNAGVQFCPWYQNDPAVRSRWCSGCAYLKDSQMRKKHHQLRATLIGCNSADDGIVDRWYDKVNFANRTFACGTSLLDNFGASKAAIENSILNQGFNGCTDIVKGLRGAWTDFQGLSDASKACRPNAIVMLTDGMPGGGTVNFSSGCSGSNDYKGGAPWCAAAYLAGNTTFAGVDSCYSTRSPGNTDVMCALPMDQLIKTYTIFQGTSSKGQSNMKKTAQYGNGEFYFGNNVSQLDTAFEEIISQTFNLAQISFQTGTYDVEGPFVYNNSFPAVFKPTSPKEKIWVGNMKKYCMLPPLNPDGTYAPSTACLFKRDPADFTLLVPNTSPVDQWTGVVGEDADLGGAGQVIKGQVGARKLYTWQAEPSCTGANSPCGMPALAGFVPFNSSNFGGEALWIHGIERQKAINRLLGYAYDANISDVDLPDEDESGLDVNDGGPTVKASWALGEAMNAKPVLVRYEGGQQYLLYVANDGFLHVINALNGREESAWMPRQVLGPHGATNYSIRDAMSPPKDDVRHVFLFDSSPRIFHEDLDADGRIDAGEKARMVVGLGRAGAAYYMMDLGNTNSWNGDVNALPKKEVYPLVRTPGTHYEDLADTWAPPWLGRMRIAGSFQPVAIFASGHERELDYPDAPFPDAIPGEWKLDGPFDTSCSNVIGTTTTATTAGLNCDSVVTSTIPGIPGYPDITGSPSTYLAGPFAIPPALRVNGPTTEIAAYRFEFDLFDVDPADRLWLKGGKGGTAEVLSGKPPLPYKSRWTYDKNVSFQFDLDGTINFPLGNAGFRISRVHWYELIREPNRRRSPSLYVVNLDKWNDGTPKPFLDRTPNADSGVEIRFTAQCNGGPNCYDQSNFPDLKHMRCPISAEVSVLTVQDNADRIYFGDECGQIWRVKAGGPARGWTIDRLLNLNSDATAAGWPAAGPYPKSKEVRKIMNRLDVVRTRCTKANRYGVYFATGNVQRPNATDELVARRDIVGVFWDNDFSTNQGVADLENISANPKLANPAMTDTPTRHGWYFRLLDHERSLRQPLVFNQAAYYKTYRPNVGGSAECSTVSGQNAYYVVDSCDGEAENDANSSGSGELAERRTGAVDGQIGGPSSLLLTRDTTAVVGAEMGTLVKKDVDGPSVKPDYRRARMLHWRRAR